jgi:hypothetical protein
MFPFDQNNAGMYQQYAEAYQSGNSSGLDHNQLLDHVSQFLQNAPPGMQSGVLQQVFSQMAPQQRASFAQNMPAEYSTDANNPQQMAQNFQQMGQQRPDLLGQLLGPGGLMSNPMAKMALTSIAGLAANQMLQRR